jgi:hypothetical protein
MGFVLRKMHGFSRKGINESVGRNQCLNSLL